MSNIQTGIYSEKIIACIDHANNAKVHLDRHAKPDKSAVNYYLSHLQDCYENPTQGFLARRDFYELPSINYPSMYVRNKRYIEYDPNVVKMKTKIRERVNKLYPKTKLIRQFIIDDGRLSLYYVKPSRGYSAIDRLKIALRIFLKNFHK